MFMKHFYPQLVITLIGNTSMNTLEPLIPHPVKNFFRFQSSKEENLSVPNQNISMYLFE